MIKARAFVPLALAGTLLAGAPALAQGTSGAQSGTQTYAMGPWMMGGGMGPGMMMGGMYGGHGMGMLARYPDGYVAFLKAELGITKGQQGAFDAFARVLKSKAASLAPGWSRGMKRGAGMRGPGRGMGPGMMGGNWRGPMNAANGAWQPPALTDALDQQVKDGQARLDALKAIAQAAKPFYAALNADQKAKADRLLGGL
jgi:hypothetical protein